jgi:hypothetical protein
VAFQSFLSCGHPCIFATPSASGFTVTGTISAGLIV